MFDQLPASGVRYGSAYWSESFKFPTLNLVFINVVVFVLMTLSGVNPFEPRIEGLVSWGADFGPLTLNGDWWRLVTAAFIHIGIIHIVMNMLVLLQIGMLTEKLFGKAAFIILYLLSAVGGSLASLKLHPLMVSAGASGAVFGLYGGLIGYIIVRRREIPPATFMGHFKGAAGFLVYNLIYAAFQQHIDIAAHAGGLFTGLVAGCVLSKPLARAQEPFRIAGRETITAVLGLVLALIALKQMPEIHPDAARWARSIFTDSSVNVGRHRLYYEGASKEEAQELSKALQTTSAVGNDQSMTLLLEKRGDLMTLSIPVKEKTLSRSLQKTVPGWENPEAIRGFSLIGRRIASAMGVVPFRLSLVSPLGVRGKDIDINELEITVGKTDRVIYSGQVKKRDAKALGNELRKWHFFNDRGGEAHFSRQAHETVLALVVKDGAWDEVTFMRLLPFLVKQSSPTLGGLPITVNLMNSKMEVKKQIVVQ